MTRPQV